MAPARRMAADRGEKAEGGGDDGVAGADSGGGQRQPESVGARGAADGVGHAQLRGGGLFKCGNRLAEDKLLRLQYMADGFQQFLVEGLVLAFEVEHGHGLWAGAGLQADLAGFAPTMVAAAWYRSMPIRRAAAEYHRGLSCGGQKAIRQRRS